MDPTWSNAIARGDAPTVAQLLEQGVPIDARDAHGQTALMLAAHAGHHAVVSLLLERGADPNVTAKFGLSALMLAVVAGHQEVARLIARAGADRTSKGTGAPGFSGMTASDLARTRGMLELAAELKP